MKTSRRKAVWGFTLIELLVVIAIIAVLMGILMPALHAARDQGKRMQCMANVKNLLMAWYMYQDENDGKLVNGNVPSNSNFNQSDEWFWVEPPQDEEGNYTGDPEPTEEEEIRGIMRGALYPTVKSVDVYRCPSDQRKRNPGNATFRSYSIAGGMNGEERDTGWLTGRAIVKYSQIKNPSIKYVFVEDADPRAWSKGSWVVPPEGDSWYDPLCVWHNNRSALGFSDVHVEMHRWQDKRTLEIAELAEMGKNGAFNASHPGSVDLKYMQERYQLAPTKSSRRSR